MKTAIDMKTLFITTFVKLGVLNNFMRNDFLMPLKVKNLFAEKYSQLSSNISKILRDARKLFITKFVEQEILITFSIKRHFDISKTKNVTIQKLDYVDYSRLLGVLS